MNFKELLEGAEPKMPGAPSGIKIMTPQQFVAKAGDEEVDEDITSTTTSSPHGPAAVTGIQARDWVSASAGDRNDKETLANYQLRIMDRQAELELSKKLGGLPPKLGRQGTGIFAGMSVSQFQPWLAAHPQVLDAILKTSAPAAGQSPTNVPPVPTAGQTTMSDYKKTTEGVEEGVDIGQEWMSDTELDQYVPQQLQQQWRELLGYDRNGNPSALWANLTGGYEPDVNDPQDRARMVKVANKWFAVNKIPNVKFFNVKDADDELEWLVQIGQQGVAEDAHGSEAFQDIVQRANGDVRGIYKELQERGLHSEIKEFCLWARHHGIADINDAMKLAYKVDLPADEENEIAGEGYFQVKELLGLGQQGVAESQEHLDRIRKLSGLDEATKLPAQTRDLGGQEFQDYMKRIAGTPDLDKAGNVKVDKKGNEKYVSGKTKTDKYKMPYIHRSSVVTYMSPDGKTYDEDAVKQTLAQRPKSLLKQNEKMKHSNGELEQFFNVGFAALVGIALDQDTNKLIIVNTCPGAGSCKVDCFAMKGGKIQFKAAWQSDGRILTYLLNDPDGFFNQLSGEISKEAALGKKGGYTVTIRWHDAGDFFSPEYQDLAFKMAAQHPDVKFYAYTKIAKAALADKPDNFTVNWSEGAHTSQEKQVKASDANLDTTKNSRIVPDQLFQDLLIKDEKGNLVKGGEGQWQVQPEKLPELKQRLAKQYGLSSNSILSYDEYIAKRKSIPAGMKYNVIVAPGEGDISANDPNIISTLLLRH